jgi:TRAP-type C4-dicarboxylate transport system permease small subunit
MGVLNKLLKWYVVILMALLMGLTFMQVIARYVMRSPFTSTDQLARIVLVWLTFMGAAVAIREGKNIRIDTIEKLLPRQVRSFLEIFFDLVLSFLLIVLTYKGYQVMVVAGSQEVLGTPFSYAVLCASLTVGSFLMLLYVSVRLCSRLRAGLKLQ